MSMYLNRSLAPAATCSQEDEEIRRRYALCLARCTIERRQQLGLSVARAAELAGIELSEWYALEAGWVPNDFNLIKAIAAVLEICWADYHMLSHFALRAQGVHC